ncbi:MAG: hypothetical protein PWQ37_2474 [Candidatus Petromonas sp.]|jgi:uncharacterized membrane protein|nr:hypothetical protein [Candidatus Petromonas sp.]
MTGAAIGFMATVWTIILIAIGVTLRKILKHEGK